MITYLHIGYPKTGTTWFQKNFFPNVENYDIVNREDIVNNLIHCNALDFNPLTVRDFINSKYQNNKILSLEGFVGTTHNFGLNGYLAKEHANRLKLVFPEADIILFIREQHDIISSFYYQYITGGGTFSVDKYLNRKYFFGLNGLPLFSYNFFEYDKIIDLYCHLFSKKKVHVFLYEDFQENTGKFLDNFCKRFNLVVDLEDLNYNYQKQRLRKGLKNLYRFANLFTSRKMLNKYYLINLPYWYDLYKPVLRDLNDMKIFGKRPDSRKILGSENYDFITEYYKKSNKRLIQDFNLQRIKKYDYPI